ncbi:hypothetical protein BDZ91DRAFT_63594 [Kalaharituber pfeilii]|nr:hypothetical protein BDZ91DRAFT_63594 [Kalaharituber pfeilii]
MPLHLLSKKSWNVYNADNIERVRRDEVIAQEKEEAEEQRMQQEDAQRRMLELRRRALEKQTPIREAITGGGGGGGTASLVSDQGYKRKTDDYADDGMVGSQSQSLIDKIVGKGLVQGSERNNLRREPMRGQWDGATPIGSTRNTQDKSGHINLFSELQSAPTKLSLQEKNPEYEKEKAEKEAKIAEQYNMALGKPADELRPWYVTVDKVGEKQERKSDKQIGIEKRRDEKFKDLNDPMAMMRRGVKQLREIEEARRKLEEERRTEIERLKKEQEELEGFTLDGTIEMNTIEGRRRRRSRSRGEKRRKLEHHRLRSRNRDRCSSRDRHSKRRKRDASLDRNQRRKLGSRTGSPQFDRDSSHSHKHRTTHERGRQRKESQWE